MCVSILLEKRELANLTVSDVIDGVLCELRLKNLHTNQRDGGGPEQFEWDYFDLHMKVFLDGKSNLQDTSSLF